MSSSELWLAGFRKRLLESAQSLTCWLLLVSLLERRLMVALFRFPLAPPPQRNSSGCALGSWASVRPVFNNWKGVRPCPVIGGSRVHLYGSFVTLFKTVVLLGGVTLNKNNAA